MCENFLLFLYKKNVKNIFEVEINISPKNVVTKFSLCFEVNVIEFYYSIQIFCKNKQLIHKNNEIQKSKEIQSFYHFTKCALK